MRPRKPRLQPRHRSVDTAPPLPLPTRPFPPSSLLPLPAEGPEDVVVGPDHHLYCGAASGDIIRIDPATEECVIVTNTGGRPLGLEPVPDGLLACDAHKGLLRVNLPTGSVEALAESVNGIPLQFCSNVVADPSGDVWFTESSTRIPLEYYKAAFMEHNPSGRLLRWNRDTGVVEVVLEGLDFPNGLAMAPGGGALILVETAGYRISRVELGSADKDRPVRVLTSNLPGFPDNLSTFTDDTAWLAFTNPRSKSVDNSSTLPSWLRKMVWGLVPQTLLPSPANIVWLRSMTADGQVVEDLHTTRPDFEMATGAAELGGKLYVAGLKRSALLCVELPQP